jgi:hypothetical protein
MRQSLQRDPFDDGLESVISAMKIDKRLSGPKDINMGAMGRRIINIGRVKPELARAVNTFYTDEDNWLRNFLKQQMAAAKPIPKPEYFGSNPDSSSVPVDNEGEGDSESDGESEGEGAPQGEQGEQETIIKEVEGTITVEEFESKIKLSDEDKVRGIKVLDLIPEGSEVKIVKKGKSSLIRIFVENEQDVERTKEMLKEVHRRVFSSEEQKAPRYNNFKKLIDYLINAKNDVVQVKPRRFKYYTPKSKSKKQSGSKTTPANTAIAESLSGGSQVSDIVNQIQ